MLDRRQGSRQYQAPPPMKFQADGSTDSFTNVNFAYSQAEKMADETGKPVDVWQMVHGRRSMKLTTMQPKKPVDISNNP